MINTDNIEKTKKLIKEGSEKPIIVVGQNDIYNRKMLEYGRFDILLGAEGGIRKGSLRQSDSGFNHVLAKIAAKKGVAFGIDVSKISNLDKKQKAELLEKIRQNIKICRKSNVHIKLINYKDGKDAFAFLISLGASSKQAKEAISF
ncbi:MAG: RNase P subunit p30 family protein [Nanoarchaeota archaeon]